MRILLVGAGGVGSAVVSIAARRDFFEHIVVADSQQSRAARAVDGRGRSAVQRHQARRRRRAGVEAALREHRCDVLFNAVDPRFTMPLFEAALAAGADYLDMAMSLSRPHSSRPYEQTGVKLGDEQFARDR